MPPTLRHVLAALLCALLCRLALAQAADSCPPTAQPPSAERMQIGQRLAQDHGFLWRISKGGRSSYLFGTVHVARFEWMFPGPKVLDALKASDTVALELDALDPEVQRRMAQGLAAQQALPLPAPLQRRLQRRVEVECLPAQALAGLGPELQVASLVSLAGRRDGLDPAYGIDVFLAGWGHAEHRTVVSLETPELQLQALRMGSAAETLEMVTSSLDELESGQARPTLLRMAQVWAESDLNMLTRYEAWCDCVKTAADRLAMVRLLDERNPALADGIDALHSGGKQVFAAVGSLHMIGSQGLPSLMARRGYRVQYLTEEH